VRLLGRTATEPRELTSPVFAAILEPVHSQYLSALTQSAPLVPPADLQRAFAFVVTLTATAANDVFYTSMTGRDPWPSDPRALIDQIVEFTAAGLREIVERCARV
jgi:hypothetical protein